MVKEYRAIRSPPVLVFFVIKTERNSFTEDTLMYAKQINSMVALLVTKMQKEQIASETGDPDVRGSNKLKQSNVSLF